MSKGTRRYHKRSRSKGRRKHKRGGNVLTRALVPAALYVSQKHLQGRKHRRTKRRGSRKRRGGNQKGGMLPLSPGSVSKGVGGKSRGNVAKFDIKKEIGGSALGGELKANLKGQLAAGVGSKFIN